MPNLHWVEEEENTIADNTISIGARISIKDLQYNKHRAINELRWRLYQELIKTLGEHPNMQGAFYVRTYSDINTDIGDIYLCGKIESIPIQSTVIDTVRTKEQLFYGYKKLSFKDRLKILFKGEL